MRLEQFLKYVLLGGIFLIPFIPFIVTSELFFPFITGKNFAFRILVELLFGCWILLALKDSAYRPSFSWIVVALGSFLVVITLADIFAENPFKAFWSNFERMEGLIGLLHLGLYFLIAGTVLNTKKLWWWFANTSVAASVIMAFYVFRQLSGDIVINQGGVRVDGTLGNAAYLAVYMLVHIFVTAILLGYWRLPAASARAAQAGGGWWVRSWYVIAMALQIIVLFYTATRGAVLGFIGGAILSLLLIALFDRTYPALRKGAIGFLAAIVVLIGGFILIKDADFIQDSPIFSRFANISLEQGDTRLDIWGIAYEGFKERPVLGWGQEGFNHVFNKYHVPTLHDDEPWFDRAHNVFFDWLTAGGALGLLAYLSLFAAALYYIWRRASRTHFSVIERSVLTGLLAAYFFHNLFVFDNLVSSIFFFSLLAYLYSATRMPLNESSALARPVSTGAVRVAIPAVAVLVFAGVYFLNAPGIATASSLINALSNNTLEGRIAEFERALAYQRVGSQEAAEQASQFALLVAGEESIDAKTKQHIFVLARDALAREIERAPRDARLYMFLGSLYERFGQMEAAEAAHRTALELSPKKQRLMFQLGLHYFNRGMLDEARAQFKRAFDLAPEYTDARIYYAAMLVYADRINEARTLLSVLYDSEKKRGSMAGQGTEHTLLLRGFVEKGLYADALRMLDVRVEYKTDDAATHLSRAGILLNLGENAAAIEAIEHAVETNPDLEEEAARYIEQVRAGRGAELLTP